MMLGVLDGAFACREAGRLDYRDFRGFFLPAQALCNAVLD